METIESEQEFRICSSCKENKKLCASNFYSDKSRPCGRMYNCITCERARSKIKDAKSPRIGRYKLLTREQLDKRLENQRIYTAGGKGRAIMLIKAYESIDKKRGRLCDLTQGFMLNNIFNKPCYYCDSDEDNIGCDRVDNSIGHLMSNVIPACKACNIARSDSFTVEEMKLIGETIKLIRVNRRSGYCEE